MSEEYDDLVVNRYTVTAKITVSCHTTVYAVDEIDAKHIAEGRLGNVYDSYNAGRYDFVIEEADGVATLVGSPQLEDRNIDLDGVELELDEEDFLESYVEDDWTEDDEEGEE